MMGIRWPWVQQPEIRAAGAYEQALVGLLQQQAGVPNSNAVVAHTGILESCASLMGRAFASSTVEGQYAELITPGLLHLVGRELIRSGEIVFLMDVGEAGMSLLPAGSWDVARGGPDPRTWQYQLELSAPGGDTSRRVEAGAVLHFQYSQDPTAPWQGIGPLGHAQLAGRLSTETNNLLADEMSGSRGNVLPLPSTGGDDKSITLLKRDIRTLAGRTAVSWEAGGKGQQGYADWQAKRLGPTTPESLVALRNDADRAVSNACGIPVSLLEEADGTAQRESWRRFLFGSVAPLGRIIETEFKAKGLDVRLTWDELRASDLQGRARAFGSMVKSGISGADAARLAGLEIQDPVRVEGEHTVRGM